MSNKSNSFKISFTITLTVFCLILCLVYLPLRSFHKLFNNSDSYMAYAYGSYEDAKYVFQIALNHPNFKWIGENHIYVSERDKNGVVTEKFYISNFKIAVDKIQMKLKFIDYIQFKKFLNSEYKKSIKEISKETSKIPWIKE